MAKRCCVLCRTIFGCRNHKDRSRYTQRERERESAHDFKNHFINWTLWVNPKLGDFRKRQKVLFSKTVFLIQLMLNSQWIKTGLILSRDSTWACSLYLYTLISMVETGYLCENKSALVGWLIGPKPLPKNVCNRDEEDGFRPAALCTN